MIINFYELTLQYILYHSDIIRLVLQASIPFCPSVVDQEMLLVMNFTGRNILHY